LRRQTSLPQSPEPLSFFCIEAALQFRVVAVKVGIAKAKQTAIE
jgi:hypothetical protein